jgi:hypothetical protein
MLCESIARYFTALQALDSQLQLSRRAWNTCSPIHVAESKWRGSALLDYFDDCERAANLTSEIGHG